MTIHIQQKGSTAVLIRGEFYCTHDHVMVNEHAVYCPDCENEDMATYEEEGFIQAYQRDLMDEDYQGDEY